MEEFETNTEHGIIEKLPKSPLPMEQMERLNEHGAISEIIPMKVRWWENVEVVTDFVIGIQGSAVALRYEDDGWIVVHEGEEVEEASFMLQMYHYEYDEDVEPPA